MPVVSGLARAGALGRLASGALEDCLTLGLACRDPATPKKVALLAACIPAYLISPVDLVPDWIVLAGWLDDAALAAFAVRGVLRLVPHQAREVARAKARHMLRRKPRR